MRRRICQQLQDTRVGFLPKDKWSKKRVTVTEDKEALVFFLPTKTIREGEDVSSYKIRRVGFLVRDKWSKKKKSDNYRR